MHSLNIYYQHHFQLPFGFRVVLKATIIILLLLTSLSNITFAQCVGDISTVNITRSIGCGAGWGSNATWDGPSGGTINDPGGSASDFTVTWTTAGTFRLKRTFPSSCMTTVVYSSYYTISAKPAIPTSSEVSVLPALILRKSKEQMDAGVMQDLLW
jgi:hypothetical protein